MDTTRRQVLAAIPAVGIATATAIAQGQDAPAPTSTWQYITFATSIWQLEYREKELPLPGQLAQLGEKGYSVGSMVPGSGVEAHKYLKAILKRPTDKLKREAWEFKSFVLTDAPRMNQYKALGAEGWEIFYATPSDEGSPGIVHAQRVKNG